MNLLLLSLIRKLNFRYIFKWFYVRDVASELLSWREGSEGGVGGGSLEMELVVGSFHYIFSSFPGTAAPQE